MGVSAVKKAQMETVDEAIVAAQHTIYIDVCGKPPLSGRRCADRNVAIGTSAESAQQRRSRGERGDRREL
jgi:hypothetical protein